MGCFQVTKFVVLQHPSETKGQGDLGEGCVIVWMNVGAGSGSVFTLPTGAGVWVRSSFLPVFSYVLPPQRQDLAFLEFLSVHSLGSTARPHTQDSMSPGQSAVPGADSFGKLAAGAPRRTSG